MRVWKRWFYNACTNFSTISLPSFFSCKLSTGVMLLALNLVNTWKEVIIRTGPCLPICCLLLSCVVAVANIVVVLLHIATLTLLCVDADEQLGEAVGQPQGVVGPMIAKMMAKVNVSRWTSHDRRCFRGPGGIWHKFGRLSSSTSFGARTDVSRSAPPVAASSLVPHR